jgi:inosose dehydratase
MTIQIGNSSCSWGVFDPNQVVPPLPYRQVLDEVSASGYEGIDLGYLGYLPTETTLLKKELHTRSLRLISGFVAGDFKNKNNLPEVQTEALRTARLLAEVEGEQAMLVLSDSVCLNPMRTQYAGRIRPEMGLLPFQWKNFAAALEETAHMVKTETGIRTLIHNHCGSYVETSGELGMLLDYTDPGLIGLCFDTGHYRFAGADPLRLFRIFGDRIQMMHFKDCHPGVAAQSRENGWDYNESIQHGIFCELGHGDVDFKAVAAELKKINYQGWIVVEQDRFPGTGSELESAKRNREYIQNLGL